MARSECDAVYFDALRGESPLAVDLVFAGGDRYRRDIDPGRKVARDFDVPVVREVAAVADFVDLPVLEELRFRERPVVQAKRVVRAVHRSARNVIPDVCGFRRRSAYRHLREREAYIPVAHESVLYGCSLEKRNRRGRHHLGDVLSAPVRERRVPAYDP